jgi:hypothetical protein
VRGTRGRNGDGASVSLAASGTDGAGGTASSGRCRGAATGRATTRLPGEKPGRAPPINGAGYRSISRLHSTDVGVQEAPCIAKINNKSEPHD